MMRHFISYYIIIGAWLSFASRTFAECANACSGHGLCTTYDECLCHRNWQSNDCSERICPFGLSHVDTPKGDLDSSGGIEGPDNLIVENNFMYPYGTTEQYPQMMDSDLNPLVNTGHWYMECSNKGTCDRGSGECICFDGYDGVSCQRASCPGYPNSCSGHGVCKTKKQIAASQFNNLYQLWDKDMTMGCVCDEGYGGADCSLRNCKKGIDPMYLDDVSTIRYPIFNIALLTTATTIVTPTTPLFTDGPMQRKKGYWALRFFDQFGDDWLTEPILSGASCDEVVAALEALPANVVPKGLTVCDVTEETSGGAKESTGWSYSESRPDNHRAKSHYRVNYNMSIWDADYPYESIIYSPITAHASSYARPSTILSGYIYRLKFFGNPGKLREPEIEIYLNGKYPTLVSAPGSKTIFKVWSDGQQGGELDYTADHCDDVTVTIGIALLPGGSVDQGHHFLNGFTSTEKALLKKCLGSSDFDTSNNLDVYNWDYGSMYYPHLIKLVRTVTTYADGGYYAVVWYDTSVTWDNLGAAFTDGTFRLLNPFNPPDAFYTDNYEVYTTKGVLALTSNQSEATFGFASRTIYMTNASHDEAAASPFNGDISCPEAGSGNYFKDQRKYISHCLMTNDLFMLLNWEYPLLNPPHLNMYTAARIHQSNPLWSVNKRFPNGGPDAASQVMSFMTHMITTAEATNWAAAIGANAVPGGPIDPNVAWFRVYKFFPSTESIYAYVATCANRGLCNEKSGECKCFPGYTGDSCSIVNSLAV